MRTFLLLAFALASCIDGTRDGSADDTGTSDASDVTDARSEVDTWATLRG